MTQVTLEEAGTQLSRLIQAVQHGEEVVITQDSRPIARLVLVSETELPARPRRKFGSGKGLFRMAPDFDAPLEDFKEYME